MINKREFVLFLSLAFCCGIIFSDLTKPKPIQAEVTNIVYDTLNAKIVTLANDLSVLTSRTAKLEKTTDDYDSKIEDLSSSVQRLRDVQKSSLQEIKSIAKRVGNLESK